MTLFFPHYKFFQGKFPQHIRLFSRLIFRQFYLSLATFSFLALQSLGFEKFDAAVVAWPHPKEQLFEVWPVAENLVDDGLVSCLGVSDVETQTFVLLHEKSRVFKYLLLFAFCFLWFSNLY